MNKFDYLIKNQNILTAFMEIRIYFLIFILMSTKNLSAQQIDSSHHSRLNLSLQLGFRVHYNTYEVGKAGGERKTLSSPMIGLMLHMPKMPLRIGAQVDFNLLLQVPVSDRQLVNYAAGSVDETWIEYQLQTYYDFKRWTLGLGAYWKRRENFSHHDAPGVFFWKYSGVQLSAGIPLNWIDLEFRTKVGFQPVFAALGTSQHSLIAIYNLNKNRIQQERFKKTAINGLIGGRFFPTKNVELLVGEDAVPIGTAFLVGVEMIHKKTGLSLSAERDWWLAINGGSFRRDIKGYINTAFLSIGRHNLLKNNKYLRFKLGWTAIIDYDKAGKLRINTPNVNKLTIYQVKGIGAVVSYELFRDIDVEIRHTFPLLGDKLFNPTRSSLGLIYRYNPNK